MINIETENYILEQCEASSPFFDLKIKLPIVDKKTKEVTRNDFKNVGYGMTLKSCLNKIILHEVEMTEDLENIEALLTKIDNHMESVSNELKKEFFKKLKQVSK